MGKLRLVALQDIQTAIAAKDIAGSMIAAKLLGSDSYRVVELSEEVAFTSIKKGFFNYYGWGANA